MGKEFVVESLEDMCSLMCDNYLPRRRGKQAHTETLDSEMVNLSSENSKPLNEADRRQNGKRRNTL